MTRTMTGTGTRTGVFRSRSLVAMAAAVALVAGACSSGDGSGSGSGSDGSRTQASNTTLVAAVAELPSSFNWNESGNENPVANDISQMLYFYASKTGPNYEKTVPGLAKPLEEVATTPKQVVRWTIHPDAMWSDGTPVTTDDMQHFYRELLAPGSVAAEHEGYDQITDFKKVDAKVFEATFEPAYGDIGSLWTRCRRRHRSRATVASRRPSMRTPARRRGHSSSRRWTRT